MGFSLCLKAVLCSAGQLVGSITGCGVVREDYRDFNFSRTWRLFKCCGAVASSDRDRMRNTRMKKWFSSCIFVEQ